MELDKLSPVEQALVKKHNLDPSHFWELNRGSKKQLLILHKTVQLIARAEGVTCNFVVVESNIDKGVSVVLATAKLKNKVVESLGEAHPRNNKNAYPTAMAQKRAYDRAVSELLGISVYSESDLVKKDDGSWDFAEPSNFDEAEKEEQKKKTKEQKIAEAMVENQELESA